MNKLHFITYNNYFNRKSKIENNIADYPSGYTPTKSQDFNPNDGRYTTHVIGTSNIKNFVYDYLLVCNETNTQIESRWFIVDKERIRGGQWKLTLKRDVLADKRESFKNAQAIIERGHVDSDNPLIFNKENFNFNQIKKEEILLKDETKIPWIVAYIPRDTNGFSDEPLIIDPNQNPNIKIVDSFPYAKGEYLSKPYGYRYTFEWNNGYGAFGQYPVFKTIISGIGNIVSSKSTGSYYDASLRVEQTSTPMNIAFSLQSMFANTWGYPQLNSKSLEYARLKDSQQLDDNQTNELLSLNDKVIYNNDDNKYYKVKVTTIGSVKYTLDLTDAIGTLFEDMGEVIRESNIFAAGHSSIADGDVKLEYATYKLNVQYEEITMSVSNTMSLSSNRTKCMNGLYDIITIPCGEIVVRNKANQLTYVKTNEEIQKNIANTLGTKLSGSIYDIQLLPYCPLQSLINSNGELEIDVTKIGIMFDVSKDSQSNVNGILFYVQDNSFTFDIQHPIAIETEKRIVGFEESVRYSGKEYFITSLQSNNSSLTYPNVTTYENVYQGNEINNIRIRIRNKETQQIEEVFDCSSLSLSLLPHQDTPPYNYSLVGTIVPGYDTVLNVTQSFLEDHLLSFEILPWNDKWPDVNPNWYFIDENDDMIQQAIYVNETTAISTKIDVECDKYRLVSPNYQGTFEFCNAKNGGVDYFNVDVTLRPFSPYIHVNPNFKNMYGADFDDARGLICQGDFSYGQLTDRFQEYELNNKNYEAMFNRQIQSMDVEHKIQKQEALFGLIAGGMGGTSSSAMSGGLIGGPAGAVVGGVVGGVASTIGGVMDYTNLKKRQEEQKDLAIDMHQFQLDNIQALPYSLTKCPAFTYNNKIFPFVERYSASDEEIKAFKHYLNLRSFNLNVVGVVKDYIGPTETFIKGQIIRLEGINEDSAIAQEIYDEFNKGVYIE